MKLYPLKFKPILKQRLWGGNKLGSVLGKPLDSDDIGESWEISGVEGDVSVVANGDLEGTPLTRLIEQGTEEVLGKSVVRRFGSSFPILIKFIDAKKDLSVQLHPNNELAKARHNSFGKTEMWYIMDGDRDANLIVGFNENISKEKYLQSLRDDSLLDLLNYESVKQGDTFFINTGKVHAIGAGVLLAEIQQTSDITYRIFDFNRKDKDGNTRELHTDLAIDAIDFERKDDFRVAYAKDPNTANTMVHCPFFKTNFLDLDTDFNIDLSKRDSFSIYMCVEGEAKISNNHGFASLKKGETILISANTDVIDIQTGGAKFLEVSL